MNKQELFRQLDAAIERMDMQETESLLDRLTGEADNQIAPEEPKLFAARIKKLDKERNNMKISGKSLRAIGVAAALVAVLSVGVYASGIWQEFTFEKDDHLVTVKTSDTAFTEKQAEELANDAVSGIQSPSDTDIVNGAIQTEEGEANVYYAETVDYDSVEEAAKALNFPIALPQTGMENMTFESASGMDNEISGKALWLNYVEGEKMFGVTILQDVQNENTTIITTVDMDPGSRSSYKAKNGITFDTHQEEGAQIVMTRQGNYEYGLVFFGYTDAEWQAIADSVDLSAYK